MNPYPRRYPWLSLSLASFTPLAVPSSLRLTYLDYSTLPKSQWGLPCFVCLTCGRFGFHLYSGRDFTPSSLASEVQRLTCLPFGMACQLISPFPFHGAYDDSLSLTLASLSLARYIKRAVRIPAFVPCIPLVSLLTASVGGVLDPFTWEYGEGVP